MSLTDRLNSEGHPPGATRLLLAICGLLVMRVGMQLLASVKASETLVIVTVVGLFGVGIGLFVLAGIRIDMERWGRTVAGVTVGMLALAALAAMQARVLPLIGTDAMLFSRAATVQLVESGTNPFTLDMTAAINSDIGPPLATPQIDGSLVTQLSYPAGAVLWFVPQYLTLGITEVGLSLTLLWAAVACVLLTVRMLPAQLAIGGVVVWLLLQNAIFAAAGGILWPLWMLPLLLGLRDWAGKRWLTAAAWLGVSAGTKQFVWLIVPFLAIWVLREGGWRRLAVLLGAGTATFSALNLPFFVLNPGAWVDGVLTPLAEVPLIQLGHGLSLLAHMGSPISMWWHSLAVGAVGAVALVGYWAYFERVKWMAWVMPPVILFVHSRTLMTYFYPWAAIGALAGLALVGELRTGVVRRSVESTDTEEVVPDA